MGANRRIAARDIGISSLLLALAVALLLTPSATAAPTEPFGPKLCPSGSEAGKCDFILGVAASPTNGHFYVADRRNNRINEFTAWGEFIKSWGWGVDTGAAELQTCTTESGCQDGLEGTGVGQFVGPTGVAVDSAGNVYVTDPSASRVQKFSPDGEFLLMFGGGVNQGPNNPGDVCTAADVTAGDTCGAGTPGTGDGEFSPSWPFSSNLAIGPGDEVYVGDKGRIQEFDTDGNFVRVLPDPDEVLSNGNPAEDKAVGSLTVDPASGDLYLAYPNSRQTFDPARPDVYRLNEETGELLDTLEVNKPAALTADDSGNVYVFDQLRFNGSTTDPENHGTRILKFDSAGNLIETIGETEIFDAEELEESRGIAASSFCFGTGEAGLYVGVRNEIKLPNDFVQAYGPTPDPTISGCEPPDVPPSINAQFASQVGEDTATVKAEINPHYFTPPVGTTTYYVQWGTAECIAGEGYEGACAKTTPAPPGTALDTPPVDEDVTTDGVVLEDLAPNTTYRYRFVSEREREAGSDPATWVVIGKGGTPGSPGTDAAFKTQRDGTIPTCPNDSFRAQGEGAGLNLRDCRAYELVSPVDKAGGDVQARLNIVPYEARTDQASVSGDQITFSAYRAFEDPQSAPFSSQYLTSRTASGWQTEAISPPQEGEGFVNPLLAVDNLYRYFSPDLAQAWLYTYTEPLLDSDALTGRPNMYRRDNATDAYEACTTAVPLSDETEIHSYQLQGVSSDGDTAAFRIEAKLTADGSDETKAGGRPINQAYVCVYDPSGNATVHLVSVLPNGDASDLENTIGGPANEVFQLSQGRTESLENAVSSDGSRVFWTAGNVNDTENPGALYVRVNPAAEQSASGACDEAGKACTQLIAAANARFWKATEDGAVALYSVGEELREYVVETGTSAPLASGFLGLVGASEDLARLYFISEDEINSEGEAGEPNLYLADKVAETTTFIATLSDRDASQGNTIPSPGNYEPTWHTARVTPDGSAVAFMSNSAELAELVADYDNTDQVGGTPAAEIYRYAIGGELACVSCNPTGARPQGRDIRNKFFPNTPPLYAASLLPTWLNALYAPRVLSDDGQRIFFESFEPLSSADANTKSDVYQWEALGRGSCTEADSAFDPQSNGCISLISSGRSPNDSQFVDASPSGDDVFIRTASSLVEWDPGAIDIYDARVGGGLPAPPLPPDPEDECEGEACRPPAPPAPGTPPLASRNPGGGNVTPKPNKKKCRKGTHKVKRKGKVRCVKNKKAKAGKSRSGRAGQSGRQGR